MSISVQQMADRVAELMESRLAIKGDHLSGKLPVAARYLPKKVLGAAQFLALSSDQAANPTLYTQLDPERVAVAYDLCIRHLKPLGAGARRTMVMRRFMATLVVTLSICAALLVAVLFWRGFL